jgi:predicted aspartyl protease
MKCYFEEGKPKIELTVLGLDDRITVPALIDTGFYGALMLSLPAALDEIAVLSAGDVPDFETIHARYETDIRFRVDGTLLSYIDGNMVQVHVA